MLRVGQLDNANRIKSFYSDLISTWLSRCIYNYKYGRPQLSKYFRCMTLGAVEVFGITGQDLDLHGKFARLAQDEVSEVQSNDPKVQSHALRQFYLYYKSQETK